METLAQIYLKLTVNTPEHRHWHRTGIFILNFEQILHIILVFLALALNK